MIGGPGVIHVRASDILETDKAKRQIAALRNLIEKEDLLTETETHPTEEAQLSAG